MEAEYDRIAEQYRSAKLHPWRAHIEVFTFLDIVGDLTGKSVLDLACGEGFYSRIVKLHGAKRVVGVDLSSEMIKLAQAEEARHPLGIEYLCGDGRTLEMPDRFDLVIAAYLFNYARSREELLEMCQAASRALLPGGRLVAINNNQDQPIEAFGNTRKYGLVKSVTGPLRAGTPITYTIWNGDGPFQFDNYYLDTPTCEWAFREAGFRSLRWHRPRLSPAGLRDWDEGYWTAFLANPPILFFECVK
jgi:SAM-dependent methyltransferase